MKRTPMKRPSDAQLKTFFGVDKLPTETTEIAEFLNRWFAQAHGFNEKSINCGHCFNWAFLFWALNKHKRCSFVSDPHHVITKINGKLYSSEFISGTDNIDPHSLNEKPWTFNIKLMIAFWEKRGIHGDYLRKIVRILTGESIEIQTADVQDDERIVNVNEY